MHHKSNLSMTSRASRLLLLNDAYNSSKMAVNLCSNSMSCVALKACLVISRLVENVAVISRKVRMHADRVILHVSFLLIMLLVTDLHFLVE